MKHNLSLLELIALSNFYRENIKDRDILLTPPEHVEDAVEHLRMMQSKKSHIDAEIYSFVDHNIDFTSF